MVISVNLMGAYYGMMHAIIGLTRTAGAEYGKDGITIDGGQTEAFM